MAEKNIGALVVLDDTEIEGIFSERDYAREVILKNRSSKQTLVGEIMTREVACVAPTENMDKCMLLMTSMRCRHLPVIEVDQIIGVLSIGDVVKAIISDQEMAIHELTDYIIGRR